MPPQTTAERTAALRLLQQINDLSARSPHDEVDSAYRQLSRRYPETPECFHSHALWLAQQADGSSAALKVLNKCAQHHPDDARAHYLRGRVLEAQLAARASIAAFERCLALSPTHTAAAFHLGLAHLSLRDYARALPYFDARLSDAERQRLQDKPRWSPERQGEDVLIWAEQGLGDEIMFSRLFKYLPDTGNITIACDARLIDLFAHNFEHLRFVSREAGRNMTPQAQAPMGDLLRWYHPAVGSDDLKQQRLRPRPQVASAPLPVDKLNVGLSWLSMAPHNGAQRSLPLSVLTQRLSPSEHRLIALQYLAPAEELATARDAGFEVALPEDAFNHISDLSHWVSVCARVITIDNATAHLAGAMGLPTDVLLPRLPNWRWGLGQEHCDWYAQVQLHRSTADVGVLSALDTVSVPRGSGA